MGIDQKILVRAKGLAAVGACTLLTLSACGQKGNLYLPNDPDFQERATLPDIVRRQLPGQKATPAATPASAPASPSPASSASAAGR